MSIQEQGVNNSNKSGNVYAFECLEISKKISKNLVALYQSREFSDVILIGSDGTQIRAHRVFLCTATRYFEETIRSMPNTKKPFKIVVNEFESGTLESVLQFIYTGSVDLYLETVRQVLVAADRFKIQPLMDLCFRFMRHYLNKSNCLNTALFAKEHDYMELYEESFSFACNHFEEICSRIDFLDLNEEMVDNIVSSDKVVVSSEEKVVQSMLMWLDHDRKNREQNWEKRLLNVRYQFMNHLFILENTHSLCINLESHKLVHCWLKWHVLPEKRLQSPEPRKNYQTIKLSIITGYCSSCLKIQTYYPQFNTWTCKSMQSLLDDLYHMSIIVQKGVFIIAGGATKDRKLSNKIKLTGTTKTGKTSKMLLSMRVPRSKADLALLDGCLYVIGGIGLIEDNLTALTSVERYNLSNKKWDDVATLLTPTYDSHAVELNGCLFVVDSDTTQCYSAKENRWYLKAPKKEKCDHFGLASICGCLFTVGGRHKNGQLSDTVERYNPSSDTWDVITSLRSPRCQPKCFAFKKSFVVVGGVFNREWINNVEEYNIETNEWKTLAPLLVPELSIKVT